MFPWTPDSLADVADVHHPISTESPGAAWLLDTAARAAQIGQQVAEGHHRKALVTLHAHYAVEDSRHDLRRVAADLRVPLCHRACEHGSGFAVQVALFRVARSLLDKVTATDVERAWSAAS